ETTTVQYYDGLIDGQAIVKLIQGLGYDANLRVDDASKKKEQTNRLKREKMKLIIAIILSAPLLLTMLDHLFGIAIPNILLNPWFQFVLATPVQFIIGWTFYRGAYNNLRG